MASTFPSSMRLGLVLGIAALAVGILIFQLRSGGSGTGGSGTGGSNLANDAERATPTQRVPSGWARAFKKTDFSNASIQFSEILSGGPPKDGIPSIDDPKFYSTTEAADQISPTEPLITLQVNGEARAYPLAVLIWHEIVNDEIAGVPISVTYCPLCNSAIVFDRRIGGQVLDFGTTGKLRFSDLVMYDRQTETWWQQFLGEGIIGEFTGVQLKMLPVRVESFASFSERFPSGLVLKRPFSIRRSYGRTPYKGYDTSSQPFLFRGEYPEEIAPLAYVVAVDGEAWSLELLRAQGRIEKDDLVITWEPGLNSALDRRNIADSRDLGNVVVQRRVDGELVDAVHDLTFAFSFNAFFPDGEIHQ